MFYCVMSLPPFAILWALDTPWLEILLNLGTLHTKDCCGGSKRTPVGIAGMIRDVVTVKGPGSKVKIYSALYVLLLLFFRILRLSELGDPRFL